MIKILKSMVLATVMGLLSVAALAQTHTTNSTPPYQGNPVVRFYNVTYASWPCIQGTAYFNDSSQSSGYRTVSGYMICMSNPSSANTYLDHQCFDFVYERAARGAVPPLTLELLFQDADVAHYSDGGSGYYWELYSNYAQYDKVTGCLSHPG